MEQLLSTYSPHADFEERFVRPQKGRTLIVGSYITEGKLDRRALYADAVGVDMRPGPGVDVVADVEDPAVLMTLGRFHHIECSSMLEHTPHPWLAAANIERLLWVGGTLHFSMPFIWRPHQYPGDYSRFTVDGVRALFPGIDWKQLVYGGKDRLQSEGKLLSMKDADGYPFHARSEVFGFGVRT